MRILYVHQYFTGRDGAGGTRSYEMARAAIARGHAVTMVCGSHQLSKTGLTGDFHRGVRRGAVDGIDVIELELGYSNHHGLLRRTYSFLRYALAGLRVALTERYDVIFATSTPLTAAVPGIAAKVFRRKPFVFEVRDLWPEIPIALGLKNPLAIAGMRVLEKWACVAADVCIGLSPGIVEGLMRVAPARTPVVLVPNGSDGDLFAPTGRRGPNLPGVEPEDFVAVFTGAHGKANGLAALLDVSAELDRRGATGIKLVLVGDGMEKPMLRAEASRRKLRSLSFLDPMPKKLLAREVSSAHVGLMILKDVPAFYYGTSPNKFFDYLAAGLPVICNYPGWVAELVTDHECGVAVPPGDPVAFADALIRLAGSPESVERLGRNARRLAETQFARERLAADWVAAVEGAGERSR